jgi:hypothetical protein
MAYTLFDLVYHTLNELGALVESIATGGSLTTIVDTLRLQSVFEDDHFNLGTALITRDAAGAGAAPEKEFSRISDFVSSTGTITCAAFTVAPASGDRYALATRRFDLDMVIGKINNILRELLVETIDTSLTTAASQLEYSLPTAVLDQSIQVWIQGVSTDTDANEWWQCYDWQIEQAAAGTAKKLIFRTQPAYPYALRIHYWLPHAPLYAASDKLHESVDINRVVLDAALMLLKGREADTANSDPELRAVMARLEARKTAIAWRNRHMRAGPKLASWGEID